VRSRVVVVGSSVCRRVGFVRFSAANNWLLRCVEGVAALVISQRPGEDYGQRVGPPIPLLNRDSAIIGSTPARNLWVNRTALFATRLRQLSWLRGDDSPPQQGACGKPPSSL
jgi:hypothetical protein